jgi:hypothetical protein
VLGFVPDHFGGRFVDFWLSIVRFRPVIPVDCSDIAVLRHRAGIAESLYCTWSKQFLEARKR